MYFLTDKLTIVWYDGPGHSRCIDLPNHPEHTQPTEVFSSFLPGQHLCKEGENNGHSTSYPAKKTERVGKSVSVRMELKPGHKQSFIHFYLTHSSIPYGPLSCGILSLKLKKNKSDIDNEIAISLNVYSNRFFCCLLFKLFFWCVSF